MSAPAAREVSLQELPGLRTKTERVSQALSQQLTAHLDTLRPLYAPERIFGKLAGGKTDVPTADRALSEVKEKYAAFTGKPFQFPPEFDLNWLTLTGSALELLPWEYSHDISGKPIAITTPLRWALNYKTGLSIEKLRASLAGTEPIRPELLRQFVVNALVLQTVLKFNPGLPQLFAALRYDLHVEAPAEFKGIPVLSVASCLQTFRPADDLISTATAFSGVPAFVELLDLDAVRNPRDILKETIDALLQ
jgi:hypothetical protein